MSKTPTKLVVPILLCLALSTGCVDDSVADGADVQVTPDGSDTSSIGGADVALPADTIEPDSTGSGDDTVANGPQPSDPPARLLAHLGVKIDPLDTRKGRAGDLVFLGDGPAPTGLFGGLDPEGSGVRPALALRVTQGALVRSPVKGTVVSMWWQADYKDYEVHIAPLAQGLGDGWLLVLDHVIDVSVAKGDPLEVDNVIGKATPWGPGFSLVELHLLREFKDGDAWPPDVRHYCPVDMLVDAVRDSVIAGLTALYGARTKPPWRFADDNAAAVTPGCLCHEIYEDAAATSRAGGKRQLSCF